MDDGSSTWAALGRYPAGPGAGLEKAQGGMNEVLVSAGRAQANLDHLIAALAALGGGHAP